MYVDGAEKDPEMFVFQEHVRPETFETAGIPGDIDDKYKE